MLGYVADAVKERSHASMFVVPHGFQAPHGRRTLARAVSVHARAMAWQGVGDKWTVGLVDLSPAGDRKNATQRALNPQPSLLGAEAVSLSGFGFP